MGRPSKVMMEAKDLRRRLDDAIQDLLRRDRQVADRDRELATLRQELDRRTQQVCAAISIIRAVGGTGATVNVPLNLLATLMDGDRQPGASK